MMTRMLAWHSGVSTRGSPLQEVFPRDMGLISPRCVTLDRDCIGDVSPNIGLHFILVALRIDMSVVEVRHLELGFLRFMSFISLIYKSYPVI